MSVSLSQMVHEKINNMDRQIKDKYRVIKQMWQNVNN